MRAVYSGVKGKGEPFDAEYRIVRPDGEVRYIHEISTPEFDDAGDHKRSVGTFQDITERRLAEQALRDSESLRRRAQEMAGIGNFVWDRKAGESSSGPTSSSTFMAYRPTRHRHAPMKRWRCFIPMTATV